MKKFLIIGGECISLMRFRGELLKSIKKNKYEVYACAGGNCDQVKNWFKDEGINFIPLQLNRTGINPITDLNYIFQSVVYKSLFDHLHQLKSILFFVLVIFA